jgi:hypothetical protein
VRICERVVCLPSCDTVTASFLGDIRRRKSNQAPGSSLQNLPYKTKASSLDLLLLETILPENEIRCGSVFSVVE